MREATLEHLAIAFILRYHFLTQLGLLHIYEAVSPVMLFISYALNDSIRTSRQFFDAY